MTAEPKLILKKGREKPLQRRHPWIFSGAVDRVVGSPENGGTVVILDADGAFLARGGYSPHSQIRARVWSWNEFEQIDGDFFQQRIKKSVRYRDQLCLEGNARRLIYAESDGIPGWIVDQYQKTAVMQFLSAGAEYWRELLVEQLLEIEGVDNIYERSDVEVRNLEGLPPRTGPLVGAPPQEILIHESGRNYLVNVRKGHKTGFYLDQRNNRSLIGGLCRGKQVLDCFSYTGGFAVGALQQGAEKVTLVDSSPDALELASENLSANQISESSWEAVEGDVFQVLRKFRDQNRTFDVIILDPPKFAPTASHAKRAARGYKDINLLAYKLLKSDGLLATFSCSGGIKRLFFQKILSDAALDAGVHARIRLNLWQSADHPLNLRFPEGSYLKGFVVQIE